MVSLQGGKFMEKVILVINVEDYDKWRKYFDDNIAFRKTHGSREAYIHRSIVNPNEIVLFFKWESIDSARKFFESEEVKEKMKEAGISGDPVLYYIEEIERSIA